MAHPKQYERLWLIYMTRQTIRSVSYIVGFFLIVLSITMLVPLATSFVFKHTANDVTAFLWSAIITFLAGFAMIKQKGSLQIHLRPRDMYLLTASTWVVVCIFAALPMSIISHISYTDAFYEAMSGITTTGATVLSDLDHTAPALLIWRSMLHWIGGIGFIVMAVAILPMLRIGGMKLFQTESSDWSEKVLPRSHIIAKYILAIYVFFTVIGTFSFWFAGMPIFDAINHAMSSIATGGFSTSDQSLGKFPPASHWVAVVLMLLGSLPFMLYVATIRGNYTALFKDEQVRGFITIIVISCLLLSLWFWKNSTNSFIDSLRIASVSVISVVTTTGFAVEDYSQWGSFAMIIFFYLTFLGGCSGSTTGGLKTFRFQVTLRLLSANLKQLIHPRAIIPQKYNGHNLDEEIVRSVLTFTFFFALIIAIIALFLAFLGYDMVTALTAAVATVCNVGPGLGETIGPAGNYSTLPDSAKWVLSFGMLLGRLEIITILVLLTPSFWRY